MSEEDKKTQTPVADAVPTKPEDTTPDPETVPPAVTPEPDNKLESLVEDLKAQVESLTESVNGILNNASPEPDSTPVKKPWTHWGN